MLWGALFGGVVVMAQSLLLLGQQYRAGVQAIESRVQALVESRSGSLAASLWSLDEAQARLQLEGLLGLDEVRGLALHEVDAATGLPGAEPWLGLGGSLREGALREFDLPPTTAALELHPNLQRLGLLRIDIDPGQLHLQLRQRALAAVALQLMLLTLLLGAIAWLVKRVVTDDLRRLALRAEAYRPGQSAVGFTVRSAGRWRGDELDQVIDALERMRLGLEHGFEELEQSRRALREDIAVRERAEQEARFLARHDVLTGLPNRIAALEALEALGSEASGCLLLLNFKGFRRVNEALGHRLGDGALCAATERMRGLVQHGDLLARIGGDEFLWMRSGAGTGSVGATMAAALLRGFEPPLAVEGQSVRLKPCIGYRDFASAGGQSDLLAEAGLALEEARQRGQDALPFSVELGALRQRRQRIEAELPAAIAAGLVRPHYQVILDRDGRLLGLEALARWTHPQLGPISPVEFIGIAEASGLVHELGLAILDHALADMRAWRAAGYWPEQAYVAVNASAGQLVGVDFEARLLRALERHGAAASSVVVEITESVLMSDLDGCSGLISRLRAHGVRFVVDDFGTGFSSLAYLHRLPVDGLKVDRSFIARLGGDGGAREDSEALIRAVLDVARHFGLRVVAEGVETQAQLDQLAAMGCEAFQGYLLGRPEPPERIALRLPRASAPLRGLPHA